MRRHFIKKYFTLLEVLVSMGVFCLLMLALMQFFTTAQAVWEKTGSRTELYDSARILNQQLQTDLSSAFYGDNDLDMGAFRFFRYENPVSASDSTVRLTLATQLTDGLNAVQYRWVPDTFRLYRRAICETDPLLSGTNGITDPSQNWLTVIDGAVVDTDNTYTILENVVFFRIQGQYWSGANTLTNITDWTAQRRPPAIVLITYAVIPQDTIDRIGRLSALTTETQILAQVRTIFTEVFGTNGTFISTSLDEGQSNLPQRKLLHDNTQFFNIVVPIER